MKTRVKIPYLNQFAIIAKRQVILFLSAYIWKDRKKNKRGLNLQALSLCGQNSYVLRRTTQIERSDSVMEIYEPFLSDCFVSINSDCAQFSQIKILRDTEASQSLILADTLPFFWEDFFWNKCPYSGCRVWSVDLLVFLFKAFIYPQTWLLV